MVVAMLIAVACLFFAGGIYAKVADVVKFENKACRTPRARSSSATRNTSEDYAKKFAKVYPTLRLPSDDKGNPCRLTPTESAEMLRVSQEVREAPKARTPEAREEAKLEFIAEAYHTIARAATGL